PSCRRSTKSFSGTCSLSAPKRIGPVVARFYVAALLSLVFFSAAAQQPPVPTPPLPPGKPDLPPLPAPPANRMSVQPAFSVVIDAAHGGTDTGARITSSLIEKDITLALAIRLRSALAARGIAVVTTRESDADLAPN